MPDGATYCTECGTLGTGKFCASCGASRVQVSTPSTDSQPVAALPEDEGAVRAPASELPTSAPPSALPRQGGAARAEQVLPAAVAGSRMRLRLEREALVSGARTGALALVAQLALLIVLVAVASLALAPEGNRGAPVDWARAAVLLSTLAMRGALQLQVSGPLDEEDGFGTGEIAFSYAVVPLLLTLGSLLAFAAWSRLDERRQPSSGWSSVLSSAAASALAFSVGHVLISLASSGNGGYGLDEDVLFDEPGASFRLGAEPGLLLLGALLLPLLAGLTARAGAHVRRMHGLSLRDWARGRSAAWTNALEQAATFAAGTAVLAVVASIGYVVYRAVTGEAPSPSEAPGGQVFDGDDVRALLLGIIVLALFLPTLLVLLTGLLTGGTLGGSGTASVGAFLDGAEAEGGFGLLAGGVPGASYLLAIPMLLLAILVGLRYAARREPGTPVVADWWRPAVALALLWAVLAALTWAFVGVEGSDELLGEEGGAGSGRVGLGLPSLLFSGFAWGAAAALLGALLARSLGGTFPRVVQRLGGRNMHPGWALLLGDAAARLHGTAPVQLPAAMPAGVAPLSVKPGRGGLVLSAVGVALALSVGVAVALHLVSTRVVGPQAAVTSYLEAAAAGDVEAATKQVVGKVRSPLLVDEVLEDEANRISDVEVLEVDKEDEVAVVTASFRVGGSKREETFRVRETDQRRYVLLRRWKLVDPHTEIAINAPAGLGGAVSVNGVRVSSGDYAALPGTYRVEATQGRFVSAGSVTITATGGGTFEEASLTASLSSEAEQQVVDAVKARLDACASSTEAEPPGCPFEYLSFGDLENPRWTIVSYPTVEVVLEEDGTVTFDSDFDGLARFDAVEPFEFIGDQPVSFEDSFSVSGTVSLTGGSARVFLNDD